MKQKENCVEHVIPIVQYRGFTIKTHPNGIAQTSFVYNSEGKIIKACFGLTEKEDSVQKAKAKIDLMLANNI